MLYRVILAILTCFGIGHAITFAQSPTPSVEASPSSSKAKGPLTPHELIDLRIQMAESGYDLKKTNDNFSAVVVAYEDMVALICMPELNESLRHAPNPTNPECKKYLDRLLEIFPEDPIGVCARDGIDSQSCATQFSLQEVGAFALYGNAGSDNSDPLVLDLKLASEQDREQITTLLAKVSEAQVALNQDKGPANRRILAERVYRLLGLQCRISRTAIEERSRTELISQGKLPDPNKKTEVDPLLGYVNDKLNVKQTPTVDPSPVADKIKIRVRYLSTDCLGLVNQFASGEPTLAAPVCVREGSVAPACIKAKRNERKLTMMPTTKNHTDPGGNGGIVAF